MGSKQVVHWTSETWWEWSEIAGSQQGSPQQPTLSVVKLEGGPPASVKLGQKSCVMKSIKSAYTLSARSLVKQLKGKKPLAYTLSAQNLVKHLKGDEASDQITSWSPM